MGGEKERGELAAFEALIAGCIADALVAQLQQEAAAHGVDVWTWLAREKSKDEPRETGPGTRSHERREGPVDSGRRLVRSPDVIECSAMPMPQTCDVEVQAEALVCLASAGPVQAVAE